MNHLAKLRLGDEVGATIGRFFNVNSCVKNLDSYGRLPLPDEVARQIGITEEVLMVGRTDLFELWNPQQLRQHQEKAFTKDVLDKLGTMDL